MGDLTAEQSDQIHAHALWLAGNPNGKRLDWRQVDLRGANLSRAFLTNAELICANLIGANLRGANLIGAKLTDADLRDANLIGANLRGANLSGANLIGANLSGAEISHAKGIVSFGPVGRRGRIGHAFWCGHHVMVRLGCFSGSEKKALAAINAKYGARSAYAALVRAACRALREQK